MTRLSIAITVVEDTAVVMGLVLGTECTAILGMENITLERFTFIAVQDVISLVGFSQLLLGCVMEATGRTAMRE